MLVALLAYRTHYASILNYKTNHLPLPWSNSHQSLRPTMPGPSASNQANREDRILKPRNENFTATAWPREPKTYAFPRDGQRRRMTSLGHAVDGANDTLPAAVLAGGHTLRRRYGIVRTGRPKLSSYPRRVNPYHTNSPPFRDSGLGTDGQRSSSDSTGGSTGVDMEGHEMRRISRRMTVDEWAGSHSEAGRMV